MLVVVLVMVGGSWAKKVSYDPDTLEALRLDMMGMESRLGGAIKEQGDRVVAALNRHGAKLDESRAAVVAAVAAASPEPKAADPGYGEWRYWWSWWQASWSQPLAIFFLGFAVYQATTRVHAVLFFGVGSWFSPYLAAVVLAFVVARQVAGWWGRVKRAIRQSLCGKCCCPRWGDDVERGEELSSVRPGPALAHSTMVENTINETTTAPIGFWAYAVGWLNPFFQYSPLGARNSVVWYVLVILHVM